MQDIGDKSVILHRLQIRVRRERLDKGEMLVMPMQKLQSRVFRDEIIDNGDKSVMLAQ